VAKVSIKVNGKSIRAATDFVRLMLDIGGYSAKEQAVPANSDPYKVLGVSPQATNEEIKQRYRQLSKIYHPDKTGGNLDAMKRLNEAYSLVCQERRIKT
jgi:DnaJ-class molecular chaperone